MFLRINSKKSTFVNRAIEDSISRPLFVLFRCFAEMVDDESPGRVPVTDLLVELHRRQPKTGYLVFPNKFDKLDMRNMRLPIWL